MISSLLNIWIAEALGDSDPNYKRLSPEETKKVKIKKGCFFYEGVLIGEIEAMSNINTNNVHIIQVKTSENIIKTYSFPISKHYIP